MSTMSLQKRIMEYGEKGKIGALQSLFGESSAAALTDLLQSKFGQNDCTTFWNYLLQGFDITNHDAKDKRFACVKCLLAALQTTEFSYRQTCELITRLCQDLDNFPSDQLVEVLEYCVDGIRTGDPKCVSWKDLLPGTLNILAAQSKLVVNGISMTGSEYRNSTVRNLCTMRWPTEVLTPIADMLKELQLTDAERVTVLNKFAGALQALSPTELPALAYQLFSMCCTAAQIIVPLLAFEKYFHRYFYKKLFADMSSNSTDFDSIDRFSDKELLEAEETILHHLNYCTLSKISVLQMCVVIRNFVSLPDVVLTPFMLSALLSMTAENQEPDSPHSTSALLSLLRTIIKNNEDERALGDYSVWCRDSLQRKRVDLEQVFTVLIDQNKEGKDVVTPGLVNLAFEMLKAKQSDSLNELAISFFSKFIRKRFVFAQGIIAKVAEWMISDPDRYQYGECLTVLSVTDTFTVSESVKTIEYIMDVFTSIPCEQSMRMMSFILPILKISSNVRDAFIGMLRRAINAGDKNNRRMAVYGFCMILKQLNNNNSQRFQLGASGMCTQHSITGFSIMSQSTLSNRSNPQRHFDMLTLEIVGLLRKCFNEPFEIKCTLYENLQRAVELNPKLVPHVLQFIDWHFRSYFIVIGTDEDGVELTVQFDKIVNSNNENESEIVVSDNLGRLIMFVSNCLSIFAQFEGDYDTREMRRLLDLAVEKVCAKEVKFEDTSGSLTLLKGELIAQQLNFIEGLMGYSLMMSQQTNDYVKNLLPLFREHKQLSASLKSLGSTMKKTNKKKSSNESEVSTTNITVNGVAVKNVKTQIDNIWDLNVVEKMMRLLHEDIVPFASTCNTQSLRSHVELVRYIMEVTAVQVESIRLEPEYKQLSHSRRTLKYLTDITKVVYERCIRRLPELWRDFDLKTAALAATLFQECLKTANVVYRKKFNGVFLKGFDLYVITTGKEAPAVLHDVIDAYMQERDASGDSQSDELSKEADGRRIPCALLQCLEVLYDNITYENRMSIESYKWLLKFCQEHTVHDKDLGLVHKLLFAQRQKTHSGAFFNTIALHLSNLLGFIEDPDEREQEYALTQSNFELKSITLESAESCLNYLYATHRKQITDVEHFIVKANNLNYRYRVATEEDRDMCLSATRSLQRSMCSQLIHIGNALLNLTNVCIPMGTCMYSLLKLLMQMYVCLKNLATHFLNCCAVMNLQIQTTKFDLVLHVVGKRLTVNTYRLITYIEANVIDKDNAKKSNPQLDKEIVLRQSKLLDNIILCVEKFNKQVILLSKKTSSRLVNFLQLGDVHDYRYKTSELVSAIKRTLSHSSQIVNDPSEADDEESLQRRMTSDSNDLEDRDAESDEIAVQDRDEDSPEEDDTTSTTSTSSSTVAAKKRTSVTRKKSVAINVKISKTKKGKTDKKSTGKVKAKATRKVDDDDCDMTTPEDCNVLAHESDVATDAQMFKNLAKINQKAEKRTLRGTENNDPDVLSAPLPKKRRGRATSKK